MYENKIHSGPNQPTGNMKKNIEFQQRRSLMDIRLLLCLVLLLLFSTLKVCADDEEEEAPQVQLKKPKPQETTIIKALKPTKATAANVRC